MKQIPYTSPELNSSAFNCPHCNAYAHQIWGKGLSEMPGGRHLVNNVQFSYCTHCYKYSIWHDDSMIYPDSSQVPLPNHDLSDNIKSDYEEARRIINRSPRGASALLRLCIQKLCAHLGESGKDINKDIAALVKKGLNKKIQKSLDVVRVIGNEAVHPGTMDLKDNTDIAVQLCKIINIIADTMITQPKMIDTIYEDLPEEKKKQIAERDKVK